MKTLQYQKRFYRDWVYPKGLYKEEIVIKETDVQILTDKPLERDFAVKRINFFRGQVENYINCKDKRFLTSLKPIAVELHAPAIIQEMARQAKKAHVGPMAAVAGAIAQFVGRDLLRRGYCDVIIENGGDIFLRVTRNIQVGLYHGDNKAFGTLRLKIERLGTPLGICTSSGTTGHSLSFGNADSVVIIANNAALADAVATATANRVSSKDDFNKAVDFARSMRGVCGVIIVLGKSLAAWGNGVALA